MTNTQLHKDIVTNLITKALPTNDVEYVKSVVTPETVTRRAGFATLLQTTDNVAPITRNFMDWVLNGWDDLHSALSDQQVEMTEIVAEGDQVLRISSTLPNTQAPLRLPQPPVKRFIGTKLASSNSTMKTS